MKTIDKSCFKLYHRFVTRILIKNQFKLERDTVYNLGEEEEDVLKLLGISKESLKNNLIKLIRL
ncbi:MAG: hypothetical protein ACOC2W_03760 [bacterium]